MHLSHTSYCTFTYIYIYIVKTVSLIFFRIARLRSPASDSGSGLRVRSISLPSHGGVQYSTGLHVLLRTGRDVTSIADLGRDSQKVLPRSCLGSLDSVVFEVTSSGDHTITLQNTLLLNIITQINSTTEFHPYYNVNTHPSL